jgi:predicted nucleic acid-binding protein
VYLVDTNVISVGAPSRSLGPTDLAAWMDEHSSELYVSAVTVAEIEEGIAKTRRARARRKAADLTAWLDTLLHLYGDRVLAFDVAVARVAGALADFARSKGRTPGFPDVAIAATAVAHGLILLTRNSRHFAPLGVSIIDPFVRLPSVS